MDAKLEKYYDGELSWLGRWWVERRLAASAEMRRELARLERLSELVREAESRSVAPDLWPAIEGQLSCEPAGRDPIRADASTWRPALGWLGPLRLPAGAFALAAAALLALVRGDAWWGADASSGSPVGVVRWIDTGSRSVLVIEDETGRGATLVWVLDPEPQAGEAGPQGEG